MEPVQSVQMNIYQSITHRKVWLATFHWWAMCSRQAASEGPTVLNIHFCSLSNNSKQQLGAPAQTWKQYSVHGCKVDLQRYRATSGETNFIELIKAPIFLEADLAIEIMQEPQSNLEEKVNSSILKDDFSSRTDPSIFTSIEPLLLDRSNETSWVFPALKSTSHFLPQSTVSCRSDSSSEANSSCCHRWDVWSHLE